MIITITKASDKEQQYLVTLASETRLKKPKFRHANVHYGTKYIKQTTSGDSINRLNDVIDNLLDIHDEITGERQLHLTLNVDPLPLALKNELINYTLRCRTIEHCQYNHFQYK